MNNDIKQKLTIEKKVLIYTLVIISYHLAISFLLAHAIINYDIIYTLIYIFAIVGYAVMVVKLIKNSNTADPRRLVWLILTMVVLMYFVLELFAVVPSLTRIFIGY